MNILLFPISILYGTAVWCHKTLYNCGILKKTKFEIPVIAIGNLSTGGTGKSPHIEYFNYILSSHYQTAILSRGYKRKSQGVQIVELNSNAEDVGDEPLQFKLKFPNTLVAVAEKRVAGIQQITKLQPFINCILLDDALQHWAIEPSFRVLLTTFDQPFFEDNVLPSGNLREFASGYQRADIIIVSKCPVNIDLKQKEAFLQKIQPLPHQKVFFSYFKYKTLYNLLDFNDKKNVEDFKTQDILVLTAIANTQYLEDFIQKKTASSNYLKFPDHHFFSLEDLKTAQQKAQNSLIICTEKDAVKLLKYSDFITKEGIKIFVLPITVEIAFGEEKEVIQLIIEN